MKKTIPKTVKQGNELYVASSYPLVSMENNANFYKNFINWEVNDRLEFNIAPFCI